MRNIDNHKGPMTYVVLRDKCTVARLTFLANICMYAWKLFILILIHPSQYPLRLFLYCPLFDCKFSFWFQTFQCTAGLYALFLATSPLFQLTQPPTQIQAPLQLSCSPLDPLHSPSLTTVCMTNPIITSISNAGPRPTPSRDDGISQHSSFYLPALADL